MHPDLEQAIAFHEAIVATASAALRSTLFIERYSIK
jgi:hypothetical protein